MEQMCQKQMQISPQPSMIATQRGKQNETAYVHYTGEYLAELKELDVETVQQQMIENYKNLFKVKDM